MYLTCLVFNYEYLSVTTDEDYSCIGSIPYYSLKSLSVLNSYYS